jgi:hypothetical protein
MHRGPSSAARVKGKRASGPVSDGKRAKWIAPQATRKRALGNTQVIRPEPDAQGETPLAGAIRARLAADLRPLQRSRVAACRCTRTAPAVQLVGRVSPDGTGRLVVRGVTTCGSVHSCPTCVAPILTSRSRDLQTALDNHRRDRTAIVTLTLRHHAGVPLRVLRVLLGRAWSEMWAGTAGRELRTLLGLVGHVRSAEQTYGENGWHPHLHCLLFLDGKPPEGWEDLLTERWLDVVRQMFGRLWDKCIECEREPESPTLRADAQRLLGAHVGRVNDKARKHCKSTLAERAAAFRQGLAKLGGLDGVMPDREHAVKAEMCTSGAASRYLAKMGCELTGVLNKEGKAGHFTSWQIARLAANGEAWAVALWREHSEAMLGARQLTWSRGLRKRLGLMPERPDEELASETIPEPGDIDTPLAELDGPLWDLFAKQQHQNWLAFLHECYADGSLAVTLTGPSREARQPPEPRSMWWNENPRLAWATERGSSIFRELVTASDDREDKRARPYLSPAERRELREELAHHLLLDMGLLAAATESRERRDMVPGAQHLGHTEPPPGTARQ